MTSCVHQILILLLLLHVYTNSRGILLPSLGLAASEFWRGVFPSLWQIALLANYLKWFVLGIFFPWRTLKGKLNCLIMFNFCPLFSVAILYLELI